MLKNTFHHLGGVGPVRERALWASGCKTWEDLVHGRSIPAVLPGRLQAMAEEELTRDLEAFDRGDIRYLSRRIAPKDHWRFYRHFFDKAVFLDIETTGMDPQSAVVTLIGMHSYKNGTQVFIDGFNLDRFPAALAEFEILVTFNGSTFDLPFLQYAFYDLRLPAAHIDLRWLARSVGLSGGLKQVERKIGIIRPASVSEISGLDAVLLWRRFSNTRDQQALSTLVRYNLEDTVNLERLLVECCNRMYQAHPFLGIEPLPCQPVGAWSNYLDVEGMIEVARLGQTKKYT